MHDHPILYRPDPLHYPHALRALHIAMAAVP